jgi:hypothetical protein
MPEKEHKRQTVSCRDGVLIHTEWTRKGEFYAVMAPGETYYKAICEQHGLIDQSYAGLTVGFASNDHANDHHGGVLAEVEVEVVDLITATEES